VIQEHAGRIDRCGGESDACRCKRRLEGHMLHASSPVVGEEKPQPQGSEGRRYSAVKGAAEADDVAGETEMTRGPGEAIQVSIEQEEAVVWHPLERLKKFEIVGFARHVGQCSGSTS